MIEISRIVKATKERLNDDVVKQEKSDKFSQIYASRYQPFSVRLIDACKSQKDRPKAMKELGFIANPERLLSKMAYMSVGSIRKKERSSSTQNNGLLNETEIDFLTKWNAFGDDTEFSNISNESDFSKIDSVLIAHGLSPTTDSLALLMDIGRAYRFSEAFGLPMKVMLADISWMSSNRSIRQFNTLSEQDIDEGLRICLDKRQRLYEALNISTSTKKIISYERNNTINAHKLKTISNYYTSLAKTLWGERSKGRLNVDVVKVISKSLQSLEHVKVKGDSQIPNHMAVLSQFPGVLQALEESLEDHLQILRSVAKHFNSYDEEIFTYFFAQYYAQKEFRRDCLKIAPISETKFDKPFDELDKYFSSWGDGHSTADLLSSGIKQVSSEEKLTAIYLPQYQFGSMRVLPYNSLSLDILKVEEKDHRIIESEILCIDLIQSNETIHNILSNTPVIQKNRILCDVLSFVILCTKSTESRFIDEIVMKTCNENLLVILSKIHPNLGKLFVQETDAVKQGNLSAMWSTWFSKLEDTSDTKLNYMPLQVFCLLFDDADWERDDIIDNLSKLVQAVTAIYQKIIE